MRRRTRYLAALAVSFTAIGLVLAQIAGAAGNDGACNSGERCGWRNSYEGGSLADWAGNDVSFTDEPGADDAMYNANGTQDVSNAGDRISSVRNRETSTIWWFDSSNCNGDNTPLAAGADLDVMPGGGGDVGDNEASSQWNASTR